MSVVAIVALANGPAAAVAGGTSGSACATLFLGGLRDPESGHRLAGELNLDPERIYVVRRGRDGPPDPIATRDSRVLPPVAMSPRGDQVAYFAWREVSCDPAYSLRTRFVVVVDTTGEELVVLPGVWNFAWSPGGESLAVVYGHAIPEAGYAPDSLGVIDIRTRQGTTFPLRAAYLAWRDSTTLVLRSSRIEEFRLRTGAVRRTRHRGWILSPDARYSIWTEREGETPHFADDVSGAEMTARIQTLLGGREVEITLPPFWVDGDPSGHLLCVSTARHGSREAGEMTAAERSSLHSVQLVDVGQGRVVRIIAGLELAATPDRRAIVVYRDGGLAFEDL